MRYVEPHAPRGPVKTSKGHHRHPIPGGS
jgi:hypothetical protein